MKVFVLPFSHKMQLSNGVHSPWQNWAGSYKYTIGLDGRTIVIRITMEDMNRLNWGSICIDGSNKGKREKIYNSVSTVK
jgi:hypothetical protein